MNRPRTCLVTLLAFWSLFTLLKNIRSLVHISNSSQSYFDRNNFGIVLSPKSRMIMATACKRYHVVLIMATANEVLDASFLLKTLLYHRRSVVNLHLVVNELTHGIAKTLMKTWEIDQFYFDLYKVNSTGDTDFYWESLKYRLADFIPTLISQEVVYLDNDVRLMDDISALWKELEENGRGNKFLGVIANNNCDRNQIRYTGKILLFDLDKFHRSALDLSLRKAKTKSEIDEMLLLEHSRSVFSIPCNWALSLNVKSHGVDCAKDWWSVKALVQSGVETSFINDTMLERAREHLVTVLRSEPTNILTVGCLTPLPSRSPKDDLSGNPKVGGDCAEIQDAAHLKRRTHLYYLGDGGVIGDPASRDPYEVSLLTQLTLDRFGVLERFLGMWEGPATIVLHLTDAEAMELPRKVRESKVLQNRKAITYHVVYKRQIFNPINYLRNVALNNSHSPYLLFVDVDLIPNQGLYTSLKRLIKSYMNEENKDTVLVVPAFQMFYDLGDATPTNKSLLLKLMANNSIVGYRMNNSWNLGHKPTNYTRWISAEEPYQAVFAESYEPYVVVRKTLEARYNELLIERMADKMAYTRLLHEQGFRFFVIPDDFVVHVPHPLSPGWLLFDNDPKFKRCKKQFLAEYFKEIHDRFNRT